MKLNRGFTLIELLIVVAIIAILAAIAVPNFLEAQVRAKVSRVKSDQRSMATAIESYYVDNNRYPPAPTLETPRTVLGKLTTPVAYMTSVPPETFLRKDNKAGKADPEGWETMFRYYDRKSSEAAPPIGFGSGGWTNTSGAVRGDANKQWSNRSRGPDQMYNFDTFMTNVPINAFNTTLTAYDPTNGTISYGDIIRQGP